MLFQSQVPMVFRKMNLQADTTASLARKDEARKRLDYYHGSQLVHLEAQLNKLFSDPSAMVKAALNITRKVIDNLAQVYREPAIRTIEGSDKDKDLYAEIVRQAQVDSRLKAASRLTKLLKTCMVRVVWRNDRLDLDVLGPDVLDVEVGDSPEDVRRVLVTDFGNSDKIEDVEYSLWSPDLWQRLNYRGDVIAEAENIYRRLPFIPCWDEVNMGSSFWLPGGEDLVSLQEAVNLKLVDLLHLLSTQSFGVGWIRGAQGGGALKVDPGSLVELPEDGAIGFEAQKARIDHVLEALDKLVKWTAVVHGLPAASLSTDPMEQSGVSKLVDNAELSEKRQDDSALWRTYEYQLFDLLRVVWNVHEPTRKLSEKAELRLDFADQSRESDPAKEAQTWGALIEIGVMSPVDVAMERNPDLRTREDALAHLLVVKDEMNKLSE